MQINTLNGEVVTAKGITWITLLSNVNKYTAETIGAYIVPSMPAKLPKEKIDTSQWNHIKRIKLADKHFNVPNGIDLLLGADFYARIIESGVRKWKGAPTAQRTSFGWIVFGGYSETLSHASIVNTAQVGVTNDQLMNMLTKFWEYDKIPKRSYRTQEEELCENIFIENITINNDGRYIARMPLQPNAPSVHETYQLAYAHLMQMEKRFKKDEQLKANYVNFMLEYISLGHMELVPVEEERSDTAIYIPHHAAGTSKFRTVFVEAVNTPMEFQ